MVLAAVVVAGLGAAGLVVADWWSALPDEIAPRYVGRGSCLECHQAQAALYHGSHHDLAMDRATPATVLGDFGDASVQHFDVTSRMYRDGDRYMIHTEGPDGRMSDFEIKYVFGVDPLQQYMVEFDRPAGMPDNEIARLQVLRISWDTARKRWFYLPPPDVDEKLAPDDDLHWTGVAQRWNTMCADCHSTNLQRNYDDRTGTYRTTFSEIDVSCEACHGPGSVHVELARSKSLFWDRKHGYGLAKLKTVSTQPQIDTCASCHSRRRVLHPDFRPGKGYYDHYANELFGEQTYYADGQILDEVYVYGSYIQSKMYHKDIRCTDCHDPHSARLIHKGNLVCTSCHQHSPAKYDTPEHHHHARGSPGSMCVECHMPESVYMEVDPRRDHSLRIPDPALSVRLGTPNACTRCHLDVAKIAPEKHGALKQYSDWIRLARGGDEELAAELERLDKWSADFVGQWFEDPDPARREFATALDAAWHGRPAARQLLDEVLRDRQAAGIVRATALSELAALPMESLSASEKRAFTDKDPQVRAAAVARLGNIVPEIRQDEFQSEQIGPMHDHLSPYMKYLLPALEDPVRLVRVEAGRVLARIPPPVVPHLMDARQRQLRLAAIDEYKQGLMVANDRAGAHLTLGILHEDLWEDDAAWRAYETAMRVEPRVTGPRSNLAALLERTAARAGSASNDLADRVAYLRREELELLERDARLAPGHAGVQYRYGLALYMQDQPAKAEGALVRAHELEPENEQFILALALFYEKYERWEEAERMAVRLVQRQPANREYQQVLHNIRQKAPNR